MTNEKRPESGFMKSFFCKGYFILSLAIAFLAFTAAAFLYEKEFFKQLSANGNLFLFFSFAGGYLLLVVLFCSAVLSFKKGVNAGTAFVFASFLFSIMYALYLIVKVRDYSPARLVTAAVLLVFGATFFIISSLDRKNAYKHLFGGYVGSLLKTFPAGVILVLTLIFACTDFLLAGSNYVVLSLSKAGYVALGVSALPVLVAAAVCPASKKINAFDLVFAALTVLSPVLLFKAIFGFSVKLIDGAAFAAYIGAFLCLALIVTLRFLNFDPAALSSERLASDAEKQGFCKYLTAANRSFGLIPAIGLGAAVAIIVSLAFSYRTVVEGFPRFNEMAFNDAMVFVALLIINFVVGVCVTYSLIISIVNVRAKYITPGDFALIFFGAFSFFALLIDIIAFNASRALVLAAFTALSVTLALSRANALKAD